MTLQVQSGGGEGGSDAFWGKIEKIRNEALVVVSITEKKVTETPGTKGAK